MIVRNVDGQIAFITEIGESEEKFLEKNPNSGFMQVSPEDIPYSRYGNYRLVDGNIVVDEAKEAELAAVQYRIDRVYPSIGEQLDMLFRDIQNNTLNTDGEFCTAIQAAKNATPKPSEEV